MPDPVTPAPPPLPIDPGAGRAVVGSIGFTCSLLALAALVIMLVFKPG